MQPEPPPAAPTEIRFYHLRSKSLEQALPELLEKVLARGWRAVVLASSPERAESLTQLLWTYHEASFLPHGSAADGRAGQQPIWLTHVDENPNNATVLLLVDGASATNLGRYSLVCELFDDANSDAVTAARSRWQAYKSQGFHLAYWQQGEQGWEKRG